MRFKTNVLTGRDLFTRMIEDAQIEKIRLETKLGINTVSEHRSTRSAESDAEDKAALESEMTTAVTNFTNAPEGSREKRKAEIQRRKIQVKLDELEFSLEDDNSNPRNIVDTALSLERTKAILDIQVAYLEELNLRLSQLPA